MLSFVRSRLDRREDGIRGGVPGERTPLYVTRTPRQAQARVPVVLASLAIAPQPPLDGARTEAPPRVRDAGAKTASRSRRLVGASLADLKSAAEEAITERPGSAPSVWTAWKPWPSSEIATSRATLSMSARACTLPASSGGYWLRRHAARPATADGVRRAWDYDDRRGRR